MTASLERFESLPVLQHHLILSNFDQDTACSGGLVKRSSHVGRHDSMITMHDSYGTHLDF